MSFAALPRELQLRIILYAVHPANTHQAATLAVVSRDCHAIIRSLLYKHIRITKPSSLKELHAALEKDAALSALVSSIHIGPDDELPAQGWPLLVKDAVDWPFLFLITTLPESLLPRWVKPGTSFKIGRPRGDCKSVAVNQAIGDALISVDIQPWRRGYSQTGQRIGARAWAQRHWRAQAILDLYLAEMRRIEDARGYSVIPWQTKADATTVCVSEWCKEGLCGHYPFLDISESPTTPSPLDPPDPTGKPFERFQVTQAHIWAHLARRGGPADHFDHLFLFTRSTRRALEMSGLEWGLLKSELGGPHWDMLSNEEYKEIMEEDGFTFSDDDEDYDSETEEPRHFSSDEEDWDIPQPAQSLDVTTEKAENFIALARNALSLLPNVKNVSLTGFLFRALDGLEAGHSLRTLNIGPHPRWWQHTLPCLVDNGGIGGGEWFGQLTHLRICNKISTEDAVKIAGGLSSLEFVVWDSDEDSLHNYRALDIVLALQGQKDVNASSNKPQSRITHARLHPDAVSRALHFAASDDICNALSEGLIAPGTSYSVLLTTSPNVVVVPTIGSLTGTDEVKTLAAQYEEGKRWWHEACVGVGVRGCGTVNGSLESPRDRQRSEEDAEIAAMQDDHFGSAILRCPE